MNHCLHPFHCNMHGVYSIIHLFLVSLSPPRKFIIYSSRLQFAAWKMYAAFTGFILCFHFFSFFFPRAFQACQGDGNFIIFVVQFEMKWVFSININEKLSLPRSSQFFKLFVFILLHISIKSPFQLARVYCACN